MTTRDRLVLIVAATLLLIAAGWFMVVSPERQKASKLDSQISAATTQLQGAEGELANARAAQTRYSAAYTSIVNLGKAVPATDEVPSLIFQLAQASNLKRVDFASISSGAGGGSGPATPAAATPAAAAPSSFTQMPFTFVFNGNFFALDKLFTQLNGFTEQNAAGELVVRGRLLTIQAVKLAPATTGSSASGSHAELSGTITADAYVLPAGQGLTGGATPTTPAGATPSTASSPTTPAVVR